MKEGVLALMIPIIAMIGGVAIAIIAIITDYHKKKSMIEKGIEIPERKSSNPYGGIKFGALIIGAAIGLTFGSIADSMNLFPEDETGYFVGVMLFAGIGLVASSLYIKKLLKKEESK